MKESIQQHADREESKELTEDYSNVVQKKVNKRSEQMKSNIYNVKLNYNRCVF